VALLPADPDKKKQVLLGVLAVVGGAYLSFTYLYTPRAEAAAALQERLTQLETQNKAARALTRDGGVAEAEKRLKEHRAQLHAVEGLIPSSEELPDLLDAISAEAQRTGVELALIQPVGATQEEYYTRRTYDLAVIGSYHRVGEFLTRVASLPRIVTPLNLQLSLQAPQGSGANAPANAPEPKLQAKFSVETYVLPEMTPTPAPADTTHAN